MTNGGDEDMSPTQVYATGEVQITGNRIGTRRVTWTP